MIHEDDNRKKNQKLSAILIYGLWFLFLLIKNLYPGKRLQNDYKTLFPKQHYNYNHLKIKIIQNLIIQNIVLCYICFRINDAFIICIFHIFKVILSILVLPVHFGGFLMMWENLTKILCISSVLKQLLMIVICIMPEVQGFLLDVNFTL